MEGWESTSRLLSYNDLISLGYHGVIENFVPENVNQSSIDIRLGKTLMFEIEPAYVEFCEGMGKKRSLPTVDLRARDQLKMKTVELTDEGWIIPPGGFVLACSVEVFHLPLDLSAEYKLKSSMARIGLNHLNAGWCDAGWHGSVLTLELVNTTQHHSIRIRPGDLIGQMVFFMHEAVPESKSYAATGRYNGDKTVSGVKA